jgi:hypothetical protein
MTCFPFLAPGDFGGAEQRVPRDPADLEIVANLGDAQTEAAARLGIAVGAGSVR